MTPDPRPLSADADKLRVLATWFDAFDDWREATNKIAPGIAEYREVQADLRRIAATLDAERARHAAQRPIGVEEAIAQGQRMLAACEARHAALVEAARAVVNTAEPDDDFEGQFVDYLVPDAALAALRAALDGEK